MKFSKTDLATTLYVTTKIIIGMSIGYGLAAFIIIICLQFYLLY